MSTPVLQPDTASAKRPAHPLYLAALIPITLIVFGFHLLNPGMNLNPRVQTHDMIYGTAHEPFVHRALLPLMVRATLACLPEEALSRWDRSLAQVPAIENLFKMIHFDLEHIVEYLLLLTLMYLSVWGFVWSLRYLLVALYRTRESVQDLFILAALTCLPYFFCYCSYPYDLTALFLFTLELGLMARRRWTAYLIIYPLACLNKETTIMLALVFFLHHWKDATLPRRRFWTLLLTQFAVFGIIKGGLMAAFRDNSGTPIEWHLMDHNLDLLAGSQMTSLIEWYGLLLLLFYDWKAKPLFLRRAVWIAPILLALTLFFGFLDEMRDYYEAYPIVALLLLQSVSRIWKFELVNLDEAAETPERQAEGAHG